MYGLFMYKSVDKCVYSIATDYRKVGWLAA